MNLRFITPNLHALLDYSAAAALILLPFVLGLKEESLFVHWFSIVTGVGLIGYSLLTDYGPSLAKVFPFKVHLILDSLASIAFLVLAFAHQGTTLSFIYCLVMGGGVIAVIALSNDIAEASPASA